MKKLEIVQIQDEYFGMINAIVIDGEFFDYGMEINDFKSAKATIELHKELAESIVLSVIQHFMDSFSEFMGRPVSLEEFNLAVKNGEIA